MRGVGMLSGAGAGASACVFVWYGAGRTQPSCKPMMEECSRHSAIYKYNVVILLYERGGGQARLDNEYRLHELNFMFVHVVLE